MYLADTARPKVTATDRRLADPDPDFRLSLGLCHFRHFHSSCHHAEPALNCFHISVTAFPSIPYHDPLVLFFRRQPPSSLRVMACRPLHGALAADELMVQGIDYTSVSPSSRYSHDYRAR